MTGLAADTRIGDSRVAGIVEKSRVIEIWHIHCDNKIDKELDIDFPKEIQSRTVNGQRERCDVCRHQVARQQWGHFTIKMYEVKRVKPWALILGLATLIPGMLIAVISSFRHFVQIPVTALIAAFVLIAVGSLSTMGSCWRLNTRVTDIVPIESLGVSTEALGFTNGVTATEAIPAGYKKGHFKGEMEFEAAVGNSEVIEESLTGSGWYRAS
jgi:hypothetical protein